jgi:L-2-hydroxycarboxylate dehydrogenase (NAD+)
MPQNMPGKGIGHFLGAMRIDGFQPAPEFLTHMDRWLERFRNTTPIDAAQPVLIPGDPERELEAIRIKEGIPLLPQVVDDLATLGEKYKVKI